jgi:hypothetical protein
MPPQGIVPSTVSAPAPVPPLRMGKFKASVTIVRESWALLKQDKEIMWFPVLSAIVSIIAFVIMAGVVYFILLQGNMGNLEQVSKEGTDAFSYAVLFVYYLVMFFILNFFQAGIYIIAHGRFNGQDLSFRDGMNGAIANAGKIFAWSFISATVGVILRIIADRSRLIGKIVVFFLGAAWGILTYFSLISLVIGKTTVQNSFKDSASVIRKTWGETIIINLSVGFFFSLLVFLGLALGIGIVVLIQNLFVGLAVLVLFIIYAIFLTIISSALDSIFKLALYEYATTGKVPAGFSPELIQNAVRGR